MDIQKTQIIETVIVVFIYVITFFITKTAINKVLKNTQLQRARRKIVIKAVHLFTTFATLILIAAIWGVKQNEIALFASTILTALGIAFFAQWSLLSNVTASIILFFNHLLKIGDKIKVMDKDYPFEGEVSDLTYFFVHLVTQNGEVITIPNALMLQKSIAVIGKVVSSK